MALWDDVEQTCKEMHERGWSAILAPHGLDVSKTGDALRTALRQELQVKVQQPGFEDFHPEGVRAIEPANPAKSLLYHALASCGVPLPKHDHSENRTHSRLRYWIETIENYVYGADLPTWDDLRDRADGKPLAIVVFAYDYRPAALTPHQKYADLCFSRTGIARIGTLRAIFIPENRAFAPYTADYPDKIPVLPARYGAFIARLEQGKTDFIGDNYFIEGDTNLEFWIPLHKVFPGPDCLRNESLTLEFQTRHINEKLRRFHIVMQERGYKTGWSEPFLSTPPFVFCEGIAEQTPFVCSDSDLDRPIPAKSAICHTGSILLIPDAKDFLVQPATYPVKAKESSGAHSRDPENHDSPSPAVEAPLTYFIPEDYVKWKRQDEREAVEHVTTFSNLRVQEASAASKGLHRPAPEVVYARQQIEPKRRHLNDLPNVRALVAAGGYEAQHYLDGTGDGWIRAVCPQLLDRVPEPLAAYSVVTAPDFLPGVNQRQVMDWWLFDLPFPLKERASIWQIPPFALADERRAPNLRLVGAHFSAQDKTVTAVVTAPATLQQNTLLKTFRRAAFPRCSFLPDGASPPPVCHNRGETESRTQISV